MLKNSLISEMLKLLTLKVDKIVHLVCYEVELPEHECHG